MNINFHCPTNIIIGEGCVSSNADVFSKAGKNCIIITGKTSAVKSGALLDVTAVLDKIGTKYVIFDETEQNPSYQTCLKASETAKNEKAEYVIGIGGGSPLDAAKAVAALAVMENPSPEILYSASWGAHPLPIIAVGTTAGTGSEVTPVSVITTPDGAKKSFRSADLYPLVSFGDVTYTKYLPPYFTRSTAIDTLAHCLESYFNKTANDFSKAFAIRGLSILISMLEKTAICDTAPLTFNEREALYLASIYGGLAISVTGTSLPHTLGYFLSEQYGICHGNACGVYLEEFINCNIKWAPKESSSLFESLNTDKNTLIALIKTNLPEINITLPEEKIAELTPRYENNKSLSKCLGNADKEFAVMLLKKIFG